MSLHGGKALEQAEAQKAKRSHHQLQNKEEEQTTNPLDACFQCCTSSSKAALEPPQTVQPLGDQVVKEVSP